MACLFNIKNGKFSYIRYGEGDFSCSRKNITSLEGCPPEIKGDFCCSLNSLKSLNGGPQTVSGNFSCMGNQIISLKGGPEQIEGCFDCSDNCLTTLEGCPKNIGKAFYCSYNQLTNLKGCSQEMKDGISCFFDGNPNLVDISDLPPACVLVNIQGCHKIIKFPKNIITTLIFQYPTEEVRKRIKKCSFYTDIKEYYESISVRPLDVGPALLDSL